MKKNSQQFNNTSYIFIPFRYPKAGDFKALIRSLTESTAWSLSVDENLYMLKYVADKFNCNQPEECQCFHFILNDEARIDCGLAEKDIVYATESHDFGKKATRFTFTMPQVQLFCFSTSVCILAFRLQFTENDPLWIASAQYYLKKVSRECIVPCEQAGQDAGLSLLALAKSLVEKTLLPLTFEFFFYANPPTERANILTYLDIPKKQNLSKELFYLRRCYNEDYIYEENPEAEQKEIYHAAKEITWGISPEAAVCLAQPKGSEHFIHNIFYNNFNKQYLFMYVLLLHQKYVLYMLLTNIGIGNCNKLETLEEYQHQLYEFEADFVFSCVTEVPQYQHLYDRLTEAFSLKKMFEDVREPLTSLSEIRRMANDKKQQNRDKAMNRSLFMLSLLTFFSALMDSFDFAGALSPWFFNETITKRIQVGAILLVILAFAYVIKNLISSKKE